MGLFAKKSRPRPLSAFANAESLRGSGKNALERAKRPTSAERAANGGALVASGERINREIADSLRRLIQPWQTRAFAYYNLLGEIKYASHFYSRSLSQIKLFAGEYDDKGALKPTKDPDAIAALDRIRDPGSTGRGGLQGQYGKLMFLTGEAYLFVSSDPDEPDLEQWEMLSTDELRIVGNTYQRFKAPSLLAEDYIADDPDNWEEVSDEKKAQAYRIWQRHPQYSAFSDSTMQGVLDLCEELVILTRAVRARARSRLAGAGILFIDDKISPAPPDLTAPDEDPAEDKFLSDLTEAMTAPIADEGSASAVVPMIVRVPVPEGMKLTDMVAHVQIIDPMQLYPETGLRTECVKRIAIGLDMPPEELLGVMDANHWTGWLIDEQSWKAHLQPKAQQLVDDLNSAYFHPALRKEGKEDWQKYAIGYDATAVINHPDRSKDAKDLHGMGAISDESLRDACGFNDDDAPTEEEVNRYLGVKIRDASLAVYGIPQVPKGGLEPEAGSLETATGDVTDATTPSEVKPGPPTAGPSANGNDAVRTASANGHMDGRVVAAAELALLRARELAGSRLRTYAKRDRELFASIKDVRNSQVAATLGPDAARVVKAPTELALVAGCGDLIRDAVGLWGITNDAFVQQLVENIERHAARTLYETQPVQLPASLVNYIHGLTLLGK